MGHIRRFLRDAGRLKPYYRMYSNVAAGLGVLLGSGLWYFVLVPAIAVFLGIDARGYARPGDPTALFAFAMFSFYVASVIVCTQLAMLSLVVVGRLRLADVVSVIVRLRYPRSWINF
jgi:hypothetical protein